MNLTSALGRKRTLAIGENREIIWGTLTEPRTSPAGTEIAHAERSPDHAAGL